MSWSFDNTGGLWRNTRKEAKAHPDYIGQVTIKGKKYYLAGWHNLTGKQGAPVLSLKVTDAPPKKEEIKGFIAIDPDDDIPF